MRIGRHANFKGQGGIAESEEERGNPEIWLLGGRHLRVGFGFFQGRKKTAEEKQTEKTNVEFFCPRRPSEPILQRTRAATLSLSGGVIQFLHWQTLAQTGPEEKIGPSFSLSLSTSHVLPLPNPLSPIWAL